MVPATVLKVVDGDTLTLLLDLGWHITLKTNARVEGVDTPELSTPEGIAVREFVSQLLPVGTVVKFISKSLDKYGRPLGVVLYGDPATSLSKTLIENGLARPYYGGKRA
jgi:micrococcal nuclease